MPDQSNPLQSVLDEWLFKAEQDYRTACRESEVLDFPSYDVVCFHAQQCIEKLLKAVLISQRQEFPKIHNLEIPGGLVQPYIPWELSLDSLKTLSKSGYEFRYPGMSADKEDAMEALTICQKLRERLLALLQQKD